MHRLPMEMPTCFQSERLRLRRYEAGDGAWYYARGQKNRAHLARYESGNELMSVRGEEDAEVLVRRFVVDWLARKHFHLGAFEKGSGEFVAQICVGPTNWDLPDFHLGYLADCEHEGQGFVSEAARATLRFVFRHLGAHRVHGECDDTNVRSARVLE